MNVFANLPHRTAIIALIVILVAGGIVMIPVTAVVIFWNTMYRNPKRKRTRECTNTKDDEQRMMFDEGLAWARQYRDITDELQIESDGLTLYGEYINFGYEKCAVVLQGRTESLLYSYYFAGVYADHGYNILVVDLRAHGLSDGKYQTGGIKESDDLVRWIDLIRSKYSIEHFTIHGVCIGGATAVYTYVKQKNMGVHVIDTIVADGLYYSYYEMFKQNFKLYKKPVFPTLQLVFFIAFILAGVRLFSETPMKYMNSIDIPILFIWSRKDEFCLKDKCDALYAACASPDKQVQFFPGGRHSHVRSSQPAEYDKTISEFLQRRQ